MRNFTDRKSGEVYVEISTRAPAKMHIYARTLAKVSSRTLKVMYRDAAERFFLEKPWEYGLKWRHIKGKKISLQCARAQKEPSGWVQVNMHLPANVGHRLNALSVEQNVSLRMISYTMLYWWTWWINPPMSERARRETMRDR